MNSNDMLDIETCAKQDGRFVPLDKLTGLKLKEPLYVDGSVRVTAWGKPLITDAQWTDIVHWWASVGSVIRDLSNSKRIAQGHFSWPGTMLFEVTGDRMTWTVRGAQTRSTTLDRVLTLRILMTEYQRFFERMKALNPACASDYDGSLAYMSTFQPL